MPTKRTQEQILETLVNLDREMAFNGCEVKRAQNTIRANEEILRKAKKDFRKLRLFEQKTVVELFINLYPEPKYTKVDIDSDDTLKEIIRLFRVDTRIHSLIPADFGIEVKDGKLFFLVKIQGAGTYHIPGTDRRDAPPDGWNRVKPSADMLYHLQKILEKRFPNLYQ